MEKIYKIWGDNDDVRMVSDYGRERQIWGKKDWQARISFDALAETGEGYTDASHFYRTIKPQDDTVTAEDDLLSRCRGWLESMRDERKGHLTIAAEELAAFVKRQ